MSQPKHTPGPWQVWNLADDEKTYGENAGKPIITTKVGDEEVCGVIGNTADAHLIAAAPDLLAALRDVEWGDVQDDGEGGEYDTCPYCGGGRPDDPDTPEEYAGHEKHCVLYAALAKADGRAS